VKFFDANSTHADLVPLQIVPPYFLRSSRNSRSKSFYPAAARFRCAAASAFLFEQTGDGECRFDAPAGWKVSDATEVKFDGVGDRYAKVHVMPPAQLPEGN
jgi:hypothetical protein